MSRGLTPHSFSQRVEVFVQRLQAGEGLPFQVWLPEQLVLSLLEQLGHQFSRADLSSSRHPVGVSLAVSERGSLVS
jgi:hypothetical protein